MVKLIGTHQHNTFTKHALNQVLITHSNVDARCGICSFKLCQGGSKLVCQDIVKIAHLLSEP